MKTISTPPSPHIGNLLKTFFRARRTRKAVLARLMRRKASAISKFQKKESVQIYILWELSHHLQHNFFADLASQLPAEFTSNVPVDRSKEEEIMGLKDEIRQLNTQVKTLKDVLNNKQS